MKKKNKKGFTLIELLSVIIILAVISFIITPMVIGYIEKSRKSSYESSVQNVFDAAKIYISNLENSDFPTGGLLVTDPNLNLSNSEFIDGIIYKGEDGSIYVENVTNGTYCASGTKNELQVVQGECETLDNTPPDLRVKLNSRTSSSLTIVAYAEDKQSGVLGYSYSLDGKKWSNITEQSLYTVNNLSKVQTAKIYVRAYNNVYDLSMKESDKDYDEMFKKSVTEKVVEYSTLEVDAPQFKLSTNTETSGTIKTLQIIYPQNKENYEFSYAVIGIDEKEEICDRLKSENKICSDENYALSIANWSVTTETNVNVKLTKNSFVMARVKYASGYVYSKINIMGIVNEGPVASYITEAVEPIYQDWSRYKRVTVQVDDTSLLAKNAYSFDGGKSWQADNYYVFGVKSSVKVQVRDKIGNITTLNNGQVIAITQVDSTSPVVPTVSWTSNSTEAIDVNAKSNDTESGIKKYICYYGTNRENLTSTKEIISSENNVKFHLDNLDVGTTYFIKIVVVDNVENQSESEIVTATPANKIEVAYKDRCADSSYCTNNEGMYVRFGNYNFVVYKKENYKAILNGVYGSTTSYSQPKCCDTGYTCTYGSNNYQSTKIGSDILGKQFLRSLPTNYANYINSTVYNTGWITLSGSVSLSHTWSKTLSSGAVTSIAHLKDRKSTATIGLIDYEEFDQVADYQYFYDNIGSNYFWIMNLGKVNDRELSSDNYRFVFGLRVAHNSSGYTYVFDTPNMSGAYSRPVVSFKGSDEIVSGKGTKASPYILKVS